MYCRDLSAVLLGLLKDVSGLGIMVTSWGITWEEKGHPNETVHVRLMRRDYGRKGPDQLPILSLFGTFPKQGDPNIDPNIL